MSSATTTIVSNGDVDFYFTGVNTAYRRALAGNNRAIYPQFAYVVPAGAGQSSQYGVELPDGSMGNGTRIKFPVSLAASRPEIWPYGQPRKVEPFSQVEISVDLNRYAPPAKREFYDVFGNDKFRIIQDQLPHMMDRSLYLWDIVCANRLVENAPAYDGIPFFTPAATPHQANPFKLGVGTFYNDLALTGVDIPNVRSALSTLESQPGPDGLPLDSDDVEVLALAPNTDMEIQLKQVFQAAIAAQPVGANAAASVSNELVGKAKVIQLKQLFRTRNAPIFGGKAQDRGQVFYLLAVPKGADRPIAVIPQRQPTAYYTGLNGSDHLRSSQGAVEFGWDAFGEVKLAIPQRAVRCVVNPV